MSQGPALKKTYMANPFYMRAVEIIIPFHGKQSRVARLLGEVFSTVATNRYLVTLVDDGSKNDQFLKQLQEKKIQGVRFLRNDRQSGFGAAVNLALRNPPAQDIPFVCVLHSDVRLETTNWLINLGRSLLQMKGEGVKMVCPKTDNPLSENQQLVSDGDTRTASETLKSGFIPMYCFLANRELFSKVGLIAEAPYAGAEAEEYCIRMKSKGYLQGVCGDSWVRHEGEGTMSDYRNDKKAQEMLRKAREHYGLLPTSAV